MVELRMGMTSDEGSSSKSKNMKRNRELVELNGVKKETSETTCKAINGLEEKMVDPTERMSTAVYKELENIPELSPCNAELAHEWLNAHLDRAMVFLHVDDKKTWVFKRLPRIRRDDDQ
ncbi:hypothetical protein MRB53_026768 [Persea americana]|uniref:Uncharacterized protein n=1 Tax=Persea americana TaxID=3435 RepID=A0ACC2LIZ0_PERAE|nr:hypothetical protein MRB53_026768 [Persea americana]